MPDIVLTVAGRQLTGWTSATVTRTLQNIASSFAIQLSERDPGSMQARELQPGQECILSLEGQRVIAGYIDDVLPSYDHQSHVLGVTGRDATGDLVDCSAATKPGEWANARLETIAAALAAPHNVPVTTNTDTGLAFRKFRIEEGETVFEAIERGCRLRGILPLPDGNGGIILGRPMRTRAGVRLVRTENILAASARASWANRFSEYTILGQQSGDDASWGIRASHIKRTSRDEGVTRHRPLTIVAEQGLSGEEAQHRADWEASVRAGRSRSAQVVVQGWRESAEDGAPLWAPGRLVAIEDDFLALSRELLIAGVQHAVSEAGTITTLTLMPEQAFLARIEPEPRDPGGWF